MRAANNGISAYIDPWGRGQRRLGLNKAGVLNVEVKLPAAPLESFYTLNGDRFAYACMMLCAAFLIAMVFL